MRGGRRVVDRLVDARRLVEADRRAFTVDSRSTAPQLASRNSPSIVAGMTP
jgi:hypothetical protein